MPPVTRRHGARVTGLSSSPHEEHTVGSTQRTFQKHQDETPITVYEETLPVCISGPAIRPDTPPTYIVDLSLPPSMRYAGLAADLKNEMLQLASLFDEVITLLGLSVKTITRLARLFLRKVYDKEQTEELRGISTTSGVDMYLLVCFNVLLDLFMGCTSGGIRVGDGSQDSRMLHYRTLDWGMDCLRKVVVQLDFVQRPHGIIVARSITYAGFVGVLTGVRKNLSISLNFRPYHNNDTSRIANFKFYGHLLLVLLGIRPSISCILRGFLMPPGRSSRFPFLIKHGTSTLSNLAQITQVFPGTQTTAAYIILSDGDTTTVFEKDRVTAVVRSSQAFVVAANHDDESYDKPIHDKELRITGMQDLVEESSHRQRNMEGKWHRVCKRLRIHPWGEKGGAYITQRQLIKWVRAYPITNEETHFATVMDPTTGEIVWLERWSEPMPTPVL